ncbi:MAG: hypothetical protein QNJ78_12070 [Gammaproteobacteria bacterium]|nr:hypothetical protein [Gammaproteobacteria bacterium]
MEKQSLKNCENCPHELIHGVACDWQPENCRYHNISHESATLRSHKHDAWAVNVAEESEYDAVKSFG